MPLYLIRHGEADSEQAQSAPGRFREPGSLTAHGRAVVLKNAILMKKKGAKIEEIWHSTKLRAKQTADIIAAELGVKEIYKKNFLLPDDPVDKCIEKLNGGINLAIVGHLPFLSNLAEALLSFSNEILDFKKGGIACLNLNGVAYKIEWLIGAEVVKKEDL
jgi:phosphohistidine phosphatase SixA